MLVRHNTSLLEQAVAHAIRQKDIPSLEARAAAFRAQERATAFKRLATGIAVAVAAVGLGLGISLLYPRFTGNDGAEPTSTTSSSAETITGSEPSSGSSVASSEAPASSVSASSETVAPASAASSEDFSERQKDPPDDGPNGPVTTDYTKFRYQDVFKLGKSWTVVTGHHFNNENDKAWDTAWCYTTFDVDGVSFKIDLATRSGEFGPPFGLLATDETLQKAGLTRRDALILATYCSWLDQRTYAEGEFVVNRPASTVPSVASGNSEVSSSEPNKPDTAAEAAYVQFGSFADSAQAHIRLRELSGKFLSELGEQKLAVETVAFGTTEIRYNVRASFPTLDGAKRACKDIQTAGGDCFAGSY